MDAMYLRALASRCRASGHDCLDHFAKEEFQGLAAELESRAHELDGPTRMKNEGTGAWSRRTSVARGFEGDG
jgi:hypothetical protein